MKSVLLFSLLVLVLGTNSGHGQSFPAPSDTTEVPSVEPGQFIDTAATTVDTALPAPPADTVRYRRTTDLDRFRPASDPIDLEQNLSQNPTKALFKSMFVPGWGQLGNRSYIKAVLFFALDAWLVGSAVNHGIKAHDYFNQYEAATAITERNLWYDRYDDQRSQRNKFTWFAVIVSFISMFDAYVDAHFSGFPDVDREVANERRIGFDVRPDIEEGGVNAAISIGF